MKSEIPKQIRASLEEAKQTLEIFAGEPQNLKSIERAIHRITKTITTGGKIVSCGNGGSMSDAMHFAEEFTARFKTNRISLPAVAISDPSYLTCVGNDFGFDQIFSRFIEGLGKSGDLLLGISTSGNSENIIRAVQVAKEKKMFSLILTGKDGGRLKNLADLSVIVPSDLTERIQEIHIKIIHIIIDQTEKILTEQNYL